VAGVLEVAVVTPEGAAFRGSASQVVVPGHDGQVAFLPGHCAFLGALGVGTLRVDLGDGAVRRFLLDGGVVQVLEDRVTVLAERVTPAEEVDAGQAEAELEMALRTVPTTEDAFAARDHALALARARRAIGRRPS
jgi:F-type H+-transporting ATPase subunit epsilon